MPDHGDREPRLLDWIRNEIRLRHDSIRTEEAYLQWIRRFILVPWEAPPRGDSGVWCGLRKPRRLPVVLTRAEVQALLAGLEDVHHLAGELMYGAGLRVLECARLRGKDIEFTRREII